MDKTKPMEDLMLENLQERDDLKDVQNLQSVLLSTYRGFAQISNQLSLWLQELGVPEDEVQRLQQAELVKLVQEKFDHRKLDALFVDKPPTWVSALLCDEKSAEMLCQLTMDMAKGNNECAFLEFCVLELAKKDFDISRVGLAVKNFEVFSDSFAKQIFNTWDLTHEKPEPWYEDFKNYCVTRATTYVFAQVLLTRLAQSCLAPLVPHFQFLSHDLELSALKKNPASANQIWKIRLLLSESPTANDTIALGEMLMENTITQATVITLYASCNNETHGTSSLLRHPAVLEKLVQYVLSNEESDYTHKCRAVLAFACCVTDKSNEEQRAEMERCSRALRVACSVCSLPPSPSSLSSHALSLSQHMHMAVVGMVVLEWIRRHRDSSTALNVFLELMRMIIHHHRLQHEHVLSILRGWMATNPSSILVQHLLLLIRYDFISPTLQYVKELADTPQSAYVGEFFTQLVSMLTQPTQWLLAEIHSVLKHESVKTALKSVDRHKIDQFLESTKGSLEL